MLAFIDNTRTVGKTIKTAIAEGLKDLGFTVGTIGANAPFADMVVPCEFARTDPVLVHSDFARIHAKGLHLWEICKGSVYYDVGPRRETDGECFRAAVAANFSQALSFYDTIEKLVCEHRPDLFVVWGGMFLEAQIIRHLALDHDIPCYATEFSFDPSRFYFDPTGVVANRHFFHQIWQHRRDVELTDAQHTWLLNWVSNNYKGKIQKQPGPGISAEHWREIFKPGRRNILLIGQCYIDTVVTMDSPFFSTTVEAYRAVAEACGNLPVNLILKPHPGDHPDIKARLADIFDAYSHVFVVPEEANLSLYSLMDVCEAGITINSQAGLEMLARHKNVLTLGNAFYGQEGFNIGLQMPGMLRASIEELLRCSALSASAATLADRYLYSFLNTYLVPLEGAARHIVEVLGARNPLSPSLGDRSAPTASGAAIGRRSFSLGSNPAGLASRGDRLCVVIVHPSPRFGGSGYYLQELGERLVQAGARVLILSEGSCPAVDNGVRWHKLSFDGPLLARELKHLVVAFGPDVVYQVGVRTKPMRAALEVVIATNAKLVVQAEDDETAPFLQKYPKPDPALLTLLDKPEVGPNDVARFVSRLDVGFLTTVLADPDHYRWVEPVLRILCYRMAELHTAIWHPMADNLARRFGKPTLVVPPVVDMSDFDPRPISSAERMGILNKAKVDPTSFVLFVSGTIYDFSNEFEAFVEAIRLLNRRVGRKLTLAVAGRTRQPVHNLAKARLAGEVAYRSLGIPDDDAYYDMLRAADLICCPGFPDEFNRLRLPSRLVKAMALARPILTFRTGFGESLEDGGNAFLLDGSDPIAWANKIEHCLDAGHNAEVGKAGRKFAEQHFDAKEVAAQLGAAFEDLIKPVRPAAGAEIAGAGALAGNPASRSGNANREHGMPFWNKSPARRKLRKMIRSPGSFFRDALPLVALNGYIVRAKRSA